MARPRRKRRGSSSSPWAAVAIFGLVLFIGAAASALVYLKVRAGDEVATDENLCPVTGPVSISAMLLDVTDPISEVTKLDLKNQFQKAVAQVPKGGLIEVYLLTESEGQPRKTFYGCNPGDGSSADPWTTNPRKIQERWKKAFSDPLEKMVDNADTAKAANHSPIMAGIQKIVVGSLSSDSATRVPRTLYLASDMMEHTDAYSMYRNGTSYVAYEKNQARDRYRTPLDGIGVKVLAFQRPNMPPANEIAEFWLAWVRSNRGDFIGFERLTGVR